MWRYLKRVLIGKPLKSLDTGQSSLTKFKALAILSSDAVSSVAYGTEQITTVLVTLSSAAIWYSLPIAGIVLILLLAITLSYRQIIYAYPSGGGAYVVATENWGEQRWPAGGSLLVDYMLTVAVSTTSGTEAITSAIPALYKFSVPISIIIVLLIMMLNLRGMSESANFLTVPVYSYIIMISVMLVWGVYNILTGHIQYQATADIGTPVAGMSMVLFIRAFSAGSSSLTGVEAISNAVPNFKSPKRRNAATTLTIMSLILATFFAGITFLSHYLGIIPNPHATVLSQIGGKVFGGHGFGFYLLQLTTAMILAVAANTGFSAFPILAYNMAKDKYMPHAFMDRGDRLGYSNGIISLAVGAIIMILLFHGKTNKLIPLYAVGVFVPFTLSQSGIIIHWFRHKEGLWLGKSFINFVGALISFCLVIFLFWQHFSNVWPYLIIMPVLLFMFHKIHNHYVSVAKQLRVAEKTKVQLHDYDGSTVIVLVGNVTRVTRGAVNYARSIGDYVIAMHVSFDENKEKEHKTANEFKAEYPDVRFVDLHTSYRSIAKPTLRFVDEIAKKAAERNYSVTVMVPQFVPKKHWQMALHNQTSLRLRALLNSQENIIVSNYNYHLHE